MRRSALLLLVLVLVLAGCGGDSDRLTVYVPQRLGAEGPPGQRVPVLVPVERDRRAAMSPLRQAVLEATGGFPTRVVGVHVAGDLATVDLSGREPDYLRAAGIVYSVTEQRAVTRVRLRLEGRACCVYTHRSKPWQGALDRRTFRGWTGEPCKLRTYTGAVRCQG